MTDKHAGIILVGLGPGDPELMTRQAWQVLEPAGEVYLRTRQHPAVSALPAGTQVYSFDELFDDKQDVGAAGERIVEQVLSLGKRPQGVIYAVPGHPLVADQTGTAIARRAQREGIPLQVVAGISTIDAALTALGVDILPHTAVVDALELAGAHVPPFSPAAPAVIARLSSPALAAAVRQTLSAVYPAEQRVFLVHAPGSSEEKVEERALTEIDRSESAGPLTVLYVPALGAASSFEGFQEIIAHLRAPDGCPWDREQTHQSLRQNLLEETYEVLAALDDQDPQAMCEEFGDLLLQIVLHAQIAAEAGEFNVNEVLHGIYTKIVRRHPHVFGDVQVEGTQGVLENWERMKEKERQAAGKPEKGLLDGVSVALPALVQAEQYQERAARVGFDWPEIQGVWDKVSEELEEVRQAAAPQEQEAEIGDLLFAIVNLARWLKIDSESALRAANQRFRRRFSQIEQNARLQGRSTADLTMDEMEDLWQKAKEEE